MKHKGNSCNKNTLDKINYILDVEINNEIEDICVTVIKLK